MNRETFGCLFLAGALTVSPLSQVLAHPISAAAAEATGFVAVQGWPGPPSGPGWRSDQERREHCWRLRNRARDLREQIYYAPPWERERMERHLWQIRERAKGECWGRWEERG
jgi:hypothetical protein